MLFVTTRKGARKPVRLSWFTKKQRFFLDAYTADTTIRVIVPWAQLLEAWLALTSV